jgi:hypothetical protein
MLTKSKTREAPAKPVPARNGAKEVPPDPVFALIETHKTLIKKNCRLFEELHEAECRAAKTYGERPWPLIAWRDKEAISDSEIDVYRNLLLCPPDADRAQIEKKYVEAKTRAACAKAAEVEWYRHAGIGQLYEQYDRSGDAESEMDMRLARTKPTTPAGAAALLAHVLHEIGDDDPPTEWQMTSLKTIAAALARTSGPQPGHARDTRGTALEGEAAI